MSYQEIEKDMIDKIPADKIIYYINILENIGEMYGINLFFLVFRNLSKMFYDNEIPIIKELINAKNN